MKKILLLLVVVGFLHHSSGQEFRFNQTTYTVNEDDGVATVAVAVQLLDASLRSSFEVTVQTAAGGSATEGTDYTATTVVVTFTPGVRSGATVEASIPIIEDSLVEGLSAETIMVELSYPGGSDSASINILDDDNAIFEVLDTVFTVEEGELATVPVRLADTSGELTFNIAVTVETPTGFEKQRNSTATSGVGGTDDYTVTSRPLVFPVGSRPGVIMTHDIQTLDDELVEGTEFFFARVALETLFGSFDDGGREIDIVIFIRDDDFAEFEILPQVTDVFEANIIARVFIRLAAGSGELTSDTIVTLETIDGGSATADVDYDTAVDTFTFTAGSNEDSPPQGLEVPIIDDDLVESTETIIVRGSVPSGLFLFTNGLGNDTAVINILDNDVPEVRFLPLAPPYLNDASESDGSAIVRVVLSDATLSSDFEVTVQTTTGGSATEGDDYIATTVVLTFLSGDGPGETRDVSIPIEDDNLVEGTTPETINVELLVNGSSEDTGVVRIFDNDVAIFEVFPSTSDVNEANGPASVFVQLAASSGELTFEIVVTIETIGGGTATVTEDYTAASTTLTFTSGSGSGSPAQSLDIPIVDDSVVEPTETIFVQGSVSDDSAQFSNGLNSDTATVNILDNDDVGGVLVNDTVVGDPLLTVPIYVPNSQFDEISLCYAVQGADNQYFNFITDKCASVNAHYGRVRENVNVVDEIAIRAVDNTNQCRNILVSLEDKCSVKIDGVPFTGFSYSNEGVSVRQYRNRVRVSVPNCDELTLVMWVFCESITSDGRDLASIKFVVMRGLNFGHRNAHGLIGQFWNQPLTLAKLTSDGTPAEDHYIINFTRPGSEPRAFTGLFYPMTWNFKEGPCLYVGNNQAGPIAETAGVDDPNDSVIEGSYGDYLVSDAFMTDFKFGLFNENRCEKDRTFMP